MVASMTDNGLTDDVYRGQTSVNEKKLIRSRRTGGLHKRLAMPKGGILQREGLHIFYAVNQTRKTIFVFRVIYNR